MQGSLTEVSIWTLVHLYNFLAWIVGASDSYAQETAVEVSPVTQRKILSVAQDILNLSHSGRLFLPKHYALGMAVRHLTGSSTVIRLLNGLGHSMSHTAVLEHDTALAETQLLKTSYVPDGFCKRTFTTLVLDNNDFRKATLTGKGTTHNTIGIIVQPQAAN
jgi:hypothetical protein